MKVFLFVYFNFLGGGGGCFLFLYHISTPLSFKPRYVPNHDPYVEVLLNCNTQPEVCTETWSSCTSWYWLMTLIPRCVPNCDSYTEVHTEPWHSYQGTYRTVTIISNYISNHDLHTEDVTNWLSYQGILTVILILTCIPNCSIYSKVLNKCWLSYVSTCHTWCL